MKCFFKNKKNIRKGSGPIILTDDDYDDGGYDDDYDGDDY